PLHTSICNRTTPLADAQEDLQFLDTAWLIYKLKFENQVFKIPYRITNANLRWIEADPDFTSIIIPIESEKDGTLELTIPRNLLSAEFEPYVDDEFIVLVDGEEVSSEEVNKTLCFRTLSVKFSGGSEEIEIIGISATIARVPPVHVTTERGSYPRDLVKVSGCTDLALDDSQVIVELSNPVGQSYLRSPLYPNGDGSFSATFFIEGEPIINGTYTATATYAGHSAASSFIVPEFPVNLMVIAVIGLIAALIVLRLNGMSKQIKEFRK
ncbi:MAG: hypothetical protein ACRD38_09305, partial [Nitrososphaerales archaeon]